jgi:hypothetical protein
VSKAHFFAVRCPIREASPNCEMATVEGHGYRCGIRGKRHESGLARPDTKNLAGIHPLAGCARARSLPTRDSLFWTLGASRKKVHLRRSIRVSRTNAASPTTPVKLEEFNPKILWV